MKRNFLCALIILSATITLIITSCSKSGPSGPGTGSTPTVPVLSTTTPSGITSTSAQTGGIITSDGGSAIITRGVCWGEFSFPTIANTKTTDGAGSGNFSSSMTNLLANKTYHVRAYATNATGTGYGDNFTVSTNPGPPSLTTQPVNVVNNKWISGGSNLWKGGADITERGVCWSTTPNPTIANNKTTEGPGDLGFSSRIFLPANSTNYIRAYATNSHGTGYGNEITLTTAYAVGLMHGGGMIFEVDGSGQHGWISSLADQGSTIPWAPGAMWTTATNVNSADGAANTTTIINVYGNSGVYAAKLCRDYRGGGFTDWYLPSTLELQILRAEKEVIGGFPPYIFMGNFNYWSSNENNYFRAWDRDFNDNTTYNPQKNQLNYVRAIRAF